MLTKNQKEEIEKEVEMSIPEWMEKLVENILCTVQMRTSPNGSPDSQMKELREIKLYADRKAFNIIRRAIRRRTK